jgi:predicted Rossmann fold flavoprotein
MTKIAIIGAGPSGLTAGITAKNKTNTVDIYEKENQIAKKILVSGNGRCNYFNENLIHSKYYSKNQEQLKHIINNTNKQTILTFFNNIGLIPNIKNGYYYPSSNKATSVRDALLSETTSKNIKIHYNEPVTKIETSNNKFIVTTNKTKKTYDKLIISTGSSAYVKQCNSYDLITNLNHKTTPILPALVPLNIKGNYFNKWDKTRCNAKLTLIANNQILKEEIGEIQLTNYGISGICVFNLSGIVNTLLHNNQKPIIKINFLNFIETTNYKQWLINRNNQLKERTIKELLTPIIPHPLVDTILFITNINNQNKLTDINEQQLNTLINNLTNLSLEPTSSKDFSRAQVCLGGVNLTQINPLTMESKIIKNLYITGELLDATGECGGYNLAFAFITGLLAGKNAGDNND